ncbi:hypothetical protein BWQ96_06757 [Gracilariopsis chorda]|uniref:BACK domain-containing protein n=1 Tax=Gracilariopsis chorda TaxID=448386 RepID=A0A2V3IN01_9FLOR|nr:hypothetical protein BWQ96_06757 [Gracilariopsis chorda]|eukprot:PXF43464.1 hypothetical protein BWQ96_06757 [Gracilariopsis chorda]
MRREALRQGWAIDASHGAQSVINANNILDHLRALPENPPDSQWARDLQSYVQTHTAKILTHPELLREPPRVLKFVLAQNSLTVPEDDILHTVLAYAQERQNAESSAVAQSSDEGENEELKDLLPLVRILSLSTEVFVRVLEPLHILSESQLIAKYKHDALTRDGEGWNTIHCRPDIHAIRILATVAESTHPYHVGHDEMLQEVRTHPPGTRTLVEFDRRCSIGRGASLTFYGDAEATIVIGRWRDLWRGRGRPVRVWVVEGSRFWVGLRCAFDGISCWGWKLMATPLFS